MLTPEQYNAVAKLRGTLRLSVLPLLRDGLDALQHDRPHIAVEFLDRSAVELDRAADRLIQARRI